MGGRFANGKGRWPVGAMPETQVWLLRHGASTFNAQHRCQGCNDEPELTPLGREGACLSGERLSSEGIETVISSPLRRALATGPQNIKTDERAARKKKRRTEAPLSEGPDTAGEETPLATKTRTSPHQ